MCSSHTFVALGTCRCTCTHMYYTWSSKGSWLADCNFSDAFNFKWRTCIFACESFSVWKCCSCPWFRFVLEVHTKCHTTRKWWWYMFTDAACQSEIALGFKFEQEVYCSREVCRMLVYRIHRNFRGINISWVKFSWREIFMVQGTPEILLPTKFVVF